MKFKHILLISIPLITLLYISNITLKDTTEDLQDHADNIGAQMMKSGSNGLVINSPFDIPEKSGPIFNVPWENDADFIKAQQENKTQTLISAFCIVIPSTSEGEQHNVHLATRSVSGTVLQPGDLFSQNGYIGPYTEERGYREGLAYIGGDLVPSIGGGACKVASTLYNLAVLSDLAVVERYNHSMPVAYLPYGQDSTVAYGFKDLKFKNTMDNPILIWAMPIENRVYMAFYGNEPAPKVEWSHKVLEKRVAPIKYEIDPSLSDGENKVKVKGMDGARIESYVTIEYSNGKTEKKQLPTSNYWPMPHIIQVNKKPL